MDYTAAIREAASKAKAEGLTKDEAFERCGDEFGTKVTVADIDRIVIDVYLYCDDVFYRYDPGTPAA